MRLDKRGNWTVEPDDNCDACPLLNNDEIPCPFLEALGGGLFTTDGEFKVRNCGIFNHLSKGLDLKKPKDRPNLKIVE